MRNTLEVKWVMVINVRCDVNIIVRSSAHHGEKGYVTKREEHQTAVAYWVCIVMQTLPNGRGSCSTRRGTGQTLGRLKGR